MDAETASRRRRSEVRKENELGTAEMQKRL